MSKRETKTYTEEFKKSSAQLAVNSEQPVAHTAKDLGLCKTTLYSWVAKYYPEKSKSNRNANAPSENEELRTLRKENSRLKQERDILKKAAAYFASEM